MQFVSSENFGFCRLHQSSVQCCTYVGEIFVRRLEENKVHVLLLSHLVKILCDLMIRSEVYFNEIFMLGNGCKL